MQSHPNPISLTTDFHSTFATGKLIYLSSPNIPYVLAAAEYFIWVSLLRALHPLLQSRKEYAYVEDYADR